MTANIKDWVDSQIVMQTLNISYRTLQRWRSNGTLPFSRIGGKILFKPSDIERILNDNYMVFCMKNGVK
jgi:excisionase family DNA binding protein